MSAPGASAASDDVRKLAVAGRDAVAAVDALKVSTEKERVALSGLAAQARVSAVAVKEYANALRAMNQNAFTGGSNTSPMVARLQQEATAMGRSRTAIAALARSNRELRDSMPNAARGPGLRSVIGSIGRAAGAGGLLGPLAGAAALGPLGAGILAASLALRAVVAFSNKDEEAAKALYDARLALADKLKEAKDQARDQGVSQFQKERTARSRLIGAGVEDADAQANALNAKGFSGSMNALGELQKIKNPAKRETAMAAAQIVSRLEGVDLDVAAKSVTAEMKKRGSADEYGLAGAAVSHMRGGTRPMSKDSVLDEIVNLKYTKAGQALGSVDQASGNLENARRSAATAGDVVTSLRGEAGAIRDPESAVRIKEEKARQDHVGGLQAMADAEWQVAKVLRNTLQGLTLGLTDGSRGMQLQTELGKAR